jgi:hypothetical protein
MPVVETVRSPRRLCLGNLPHPPNPPLSPKMGVVRVWVWSEVLQNQA